MQFLSEHARYIPEILGSDWFGRQSILGRVSKGDAAFWVEHASIPNCDIQALSRQRIFPDYKASLRWEKNATEIFDTSIFPDNHDAAPHYLRLGTRLDPIEFDVRRLVYVPSSGGMGIYGHWLLDIIPSLITVRKIFQTQIPLYLDPQQPRWVHDLIKAFDLPIVAQLRSDEVPLFSGLPRYHDYLNTSIFREYSRLIRKNILGEKVKSGSRIYVSRANLNKNSRVLLNEAEVSDFFLSAGFQVVFPEEMTIRDQIAMFSTAQVVAGEAGSGLHNSIFCGDDTILINLQSSRQSHFIQAGLCHAFNQRPIYIFGKSSSSDWSSNFTIDTRDCAEALKML
jgi:capsular polysaccharide biosynthesis protein